MAGKNEDIKTADYILQQKIVVEEKFGRKLTKKPNSFSKNRPKKSILKEIRAQTVKYMEN